MYIIPIHRPWRKLRGGICRYKTFWMRIFVRTTFLLLTVDVVVYMLHYVFSRHIPLEFSSKVLAQTAMHSGITHER